MKNRLLLLLPALMFTIFAFGQHQIYLPWEFAGGPPCPIRDVVLHQGILYAATDCGLYKRPESGGIWERQPGTPDLAALFVAANAGAVVAVFRRIEGYYDIGNSALYFFSSKDNGASFVYQYHYEYNNWYDTYGDVAAETDFSRLYAFGDSTFVLAARQCERGCIYVRVASTDNGQNWTYEALPGFYYNFPLNPSAEQGDTIATFNFDQLILSNTADLQQLAVIPIVPPLDSTAAGLTWVNNRLTVTFEKGSYAYADTLAQQWISGSLPFTGIHDFFYYENYYYWCTESGFYRSATIGPATPETMYTRPGPLGAVQRAHRGTNGWYLLANGVLLWLPDGASTATSMITDGLNRAAGVLSSLPGRLLFRNDKGLWWQSPDGDSWSVYENETVYTQHFQNFYAGDTFCLAYTSSTNWPPKVYRSTDGGVNWSFSINQYGFDFIKNRYDERVYFNNIFTADGGITWDTLPNGYSPTAALGDTLLTSYNEKISFDHGQNWQDLILPTPSSSFGYHYYAYSLAGRTLYAYPASGLPVYRSSDFGTTWEEIGVGESAGEFTGKGASHVVGQTTYLQDAHTLVLLPASGQGYFVVGNTPFGRVSFLPGYYYALRNFGRFVQKDSTVYAARQRGVWRLSSCYAEHPFATPTRDTTICQGSAVLFHGDTLRMAGTYMHKIPGLTTFCDSMDVLRVKVNLIKTYWQTRICPGDTLLWNGHAYSGYGTFMQQLTTATGCDSSVTLYLNSYNTNASVNIPLCAGDTLQLNGQTIFTPGQHTFHLNSFAGCDSTLIANVYDGQDTFNLTPVICAGSSYHHSGQSFTQPGEYWITRNFAIQPCPTTYHIILTVLPDVAIAVDTAVTVGTLLYHRVVTSDTTFTVLLPGLANCDTILTITAYTTVDVDDLNTQQAAQAFPNPFRDQLTLRWPSGASAQVRLYDAQGRLCREARLTGPTVTWLTGNLPPGFYRVEIGVGERYYAWKLVKMP
ncbi:MAG: T9SS type A sorting domain-containing protein [Saprospiraceae bacterium]|nr:T9SS type A sorting domain-containing protein [Saprospiraceae bacterium]